MLRIDFYLISESTDNERLRFACRLLEKAYLQNHRIYINTNNETEARLLNDLLWTFRDVGFVPHGLVGEQNTEKASVQIGYSKNPKLHKDILLNLTQEIPEFYTEFERVIEIIPEQPEWKNKARENFKKYKENNHQIETHDLRKQ